MKKVLFKRFAVLLLELVVTTIIGDAVCKKMDKLFNVEPITPSMFMKKEK